MENRIIREELLKVVKGRGGSKKNTRAELEPEKYYNEYEDDGSLEYEKMVQSIVKQIATELFPDEVKIDPMGAYASVKDRDIKRVLKALRDKRAHEIKLLKEKNAKVSSLIDDSERYKNAQKRYALSDKIAGLQDDEIYDLENPDYSKWRNIKRDPEVQSQKVKRLLDIINKPVTKEEGKIVGNGRSRSDASGHKQFIKEYFRKHHKKGTPASETMVRANKEWRACK